MQPHIKLILVPKNLYHERCNAVAINFVFNQFIQQIKQLNVILTTKVDLVVNADK